VANKTAPDVTGAIQRIDHVVDSFGGCSPALLDFASGVVEYIGQSFPDAGASVQFRIAVYLYDVAAGFGRVTDDALASAAGYAVAAYRLAGPLRG
jgi:hypothetical protein